MAPATAQSSPSTGFYEPLRDSETSDDDDNPFHDDSEEDDGPRSPPLLSAPFDDTTIDVASGVDGATDLFEATIGDNGGTGRDPENASQIQPPPPAAASESTAAIMAEFARIVERREADLALSFTRQNEEFALSLTRQKEEFALSFTRQKE